MTPDQLKALLDTVVTDLNTAGDFAGTLDPALIPFIQIGKAVDKLVPGLAASVDKWIQGNPPTDQEKAEVLQQLNVLGNPNLP